LVRILHTDGASRPVSPRRTPQNTGGAILA